MRNTETYRNTGYNLGETTMGFKVVKYSTNYEKYTLYQARG